MFYIIEKGVKLTPAFGTGSAEGERGSWHLVQFIRHLPHLTPAELDRMKKALNPRGPDEWRQEYSDSWCPTVKVGKMRANFGRLNALHNHTLPWADRPLVMYNLLGGPPRIVTQASKTRVCRSAG